MFAGCGSPWKKPWRKIIVIQVSAIRYASRRRWSIVQLSRSRSASCTPSRYSSVSTRGRRVRPVDARHGDVRVPGEVPVERIGVPALEPVVELLTDRPRELVDDLVRVDEVERANPLLREACRLVHEREIRLDLSWRVRPLDLDDDPPAVRQHSAVHLADRRSRERLLLELEEQPLDRLSELVLNRALDVCERERTNVVLQAPQLGDDVGRHDVGPRREQLAELDERRARARRASRGDAGRGPSTR